MDQIHNRLERVVVVYSNVEEGWPGEGNIDADPCFADPNTGDYHLKSQAGRWLADEARWVTDEATSPCIDLGDPMKPVGPESFPNGGRVNMGAYGGTEQASRSYFGAPICETIIPGDINGDCRADFRDLVIMLSHWLWNDTPSVSIISPTPEEAIGRYQANDPIPLVAEASDSGAAIEKVEFFIDGSAVELEIGLVGQDTDGTDGWSFDWIWWGDWGSYPEGYYTVTAQATDESGTAGISRPIRFSVHGPK